MAISCLCCFIQGCQNMPPSKATVAKSKTITQFVKNQYASDFKVFFDNILKVVKTPSSSLDNYTEKVLPDNKSVIWRAFFTTMNSRYLYMPRDDIKHYCMAQQGRLALSTPFKEAFDGLYYNPTEVYFKTLASNLPKEITVSTFIPGMSATYEVNKHEVAVANAITAHFSNNSALSLTYQDAIKAGAFGCFDCVSNKTSTSMWRVIIRPIAFKPENQHNKFETNILYLLISPNDNAL